MPLVLDTGATRSVMTPGMARDLGVHVRRARTRPYRRPTRLGRDLQFFVDASSSDTGARGGWEYGLLGGEFLARYVLEIDCAARRVRFLDAGRYRVPEVPADDRETVVRLRTPANRPHAEVLLDGHAVRLLVDTGDPFSLWIPRARADGIGLALSPMAGLEVWGVRGPYRELSVGEVGELSLGGLRLARVPVIAAPSDYNQGDASGAALGMDVLARFVVRIDYPRRRLWLRESRPGPATFHGLAWPPARRSGVLVAPGVDALDVVYAIEGSPGWRRGLRPGDRIPTSGPGGAEDARALADRVERGDGLVVRRPDGDGWEELPSAPPP
jgi:predicted aspartyl protease